MTTDSKALLTDEQIQKIRDSHAQSTDTVRRRAGRPRNADVDLKTLALAAVIRELRRGNGRVGLAVLEALGTLHPEREQSTTLTSTIATLLPSSDSNSTMNEPSKQPRSPAGDGDNTDSSTKFSQSGLTPPEEPADSAPVKGGEEDK